MSPAKTLNLKLSVSASEFVKSEPCFKDRADMIATVLQQKTKAEIKQLYSVSDAIATESYTWLANWKLDPDETDTYPAGYLYDGPAFHGLDFKSLSPTEIERGVKHLRILSGMYGILSPHDMIQPYRLDMATKFTIYDEGANLYDFWGKDIAYRINEELAVQPEEVKILINLASDEYYKSVNLPALDPHVKVIQIVFKEKGRVISFHAKRARGLIARFILQQAASLSSCESVSEIILSKLKTFSEENYIYDPNHSSEHNYVYNRHSAPNCSLQSIANLNALKSVNTTPCKSNFNVHHSSSTSTSTSTINIPLPAPPSHTSSPPVPLSTSTGKRSSSGSHSGRKKDHNHTLLKADKRRDDVESGSGNGETSGGNGTGTSNNGQQAVKSSTKRKKSKVPKEKVVENENYDEIRDREEFEGFLDDRGEIRKRKSHKAL
eukprot:CAMPEP_0182428588 /NCGR_PEP_ID=MMETSP1167-20130531/23131_1 /TAXON_ID=2988 /ORGANISM="Mallomonas Sp, Strain CCMP3275" /LENGTH=434 /DNA_ID=CAMNT_0024611561 /DNA_START=104 /DNA_END=1408 /DNA_ORIENTATION=+